MTPFIVGAPSDQIFIALQRAGVFVEEPADVRRVVIDLTAGESARVWIEKLLDERIVDVLMSSDIVERPR